MIFAHLFNAGIWMHLACDYINIARASSLMQSLSNELASGTGQCTEQGSCSVDDIPKSTDADCIYLYVFSAL